MYKHVLSLAVLATGMVVAAVPADAQVRRGHVAVAQAPAGGAAQWRSAVREPGSATIRRGLQTPDGRGYRHSRSREYDPGHYSADRSTQFNNGRGATSATANGDGTANYSTTFTGPQGASRNVSGTVQRRRP